MPQMPAALGSNLRHTSLQKHYKQLDRICRSYWRLQSYILATPQVYTTVSRRCAMERQFPTTCETVPRLRAELPSVCFQFLKHWQRQFNIQKLRIEVGVRRSVFSETAC